MHFLPQNRTCSCADFGWDVNGWESFGESIRLLEFAVGNDLMNKVVFTIGEHDSYYFFKHGAIVYTVERRLTYDKFPTENGQAWLRRILHIYSISFENETNNCWLKEFSGLTPTSNEPQSCNNGKRKYILKRNREFDELLHNGVDLLHLRCEGCEYVFLFYLISSGLIRNIVRLNFALHNEPGYQQLRCKLQSELFSTHVPTYCSGMWQGWIRRGEHSLVDRHFALPSAILPQILGVGSPDPHHVAHGSTAFSVLHVKAECPPAILLLGDSIDRFIVRDFCEAQNLTFDDWSGQTFRYRPEDVSSATSLCRSPNGTVGHLHLFGSNSSGPYRNNVFSTRMDPFVDTPLRICKGIEVFTQTVGPPAALVFQTVLWDGLGLSKQVWLTDAERAESFRAGLFARVRDINRCRGRATELVLRTVPKSIWASELTALLNAVVRNASAALGLRLLDWDADLRAWSGPKETEWDRFRDAFHPTAKYCARFASELLARQPCPPPQPPPLLGPGSESPVGTRRLGGAEGASG